MTINGCLSPRRCFCIALLSLSALLAAPGALSAPTTTDRLNMGLGGVVYLVLNQNGDGSWGHGNAESVRATQQAIWALSIYHVGGIPLDRAITWIYNAEAESPDAAARLLLGVSQVSIEAPSLVAQLDGMAYPAQTSTQQDTLVWGSQPGYVPTTLDQIYALRAKLAVSGSVDADIQTYWGLIASAQQTGAPDSVQGSGWGYAMPPYDNGAGSFNSAVNPTAEALIAMAQVDYAAQGGYWNATSAENAISWLLTKQQSGGAFGDDAGNVLSTSLAVLALEAAKSHETTVPAAWQQAEDDALTYLQGQQQSDGSWNADLFTTALAVQAVTAGIAVTNVDTDGDQLPDYLETAIGLDPNVYNSTLLERSNGNNYRDKASAATIQVEVIVNQFNQKVFNVSSGTPTLVGDIPPGMTFDPATDTLSGTPTRTGQYVLTLQIDLGANDNYLVPIIVFVVNPGDDLDGDGMPASYEEQYSANLNPFDKSDGARDDDGDGLTNLQEYLAGSSPTDAAPVVTITAPVSGTTVTPGTAIHFTASAIDREDGDISGNITWSSDIDGPLGTGASLDVTLSRNTHRITATVTDSAGGRPVSPPSIVVTVAVRGDINNDGVADATDVLLLQQYLLGFTNLSDAEKVRADLYPATPDGVLTASDLLLLQQTVLGTAGQ